jgi:hypothetical protein
MPTKNFGWMTLTPGQIEVSSGYNAFVNELDSLMVGILQVFKDLWGQYVSGLQVTLVGTVLQVDGGWAILRDGRVFVNESAQQIAGDAGFVVVDSATKTITLKSAPNDETDILLAYVSGSTVYDLRFPTKDYLTHAIPTPFLNVLQGTMNVVGMTPQVTVNQDTPFKAETVLSPEGSATTLNVPIALRFGLPTLPSPASSLTVHFGIGTNAPPSASDVFVGVVWDGSNWKAYTSNLGSTYQQTLPSGTTAIKVVVRGGRSEWQVKVGDTWQALNVLSAPVGDFSIKGYISIQSSSASSSTVSLPPVMFVTTR